VQQVLSQKVAEASVQIARRLADKPIAVHWVTAALGAVVAFGSLCVVAGYNLATTAKLPRVLTEERRGGAARIFGAIAGVPAGWMVFALLVPLAALGARTGWVTAADTAAERGARILGGCLVAASVSGCIACVVMLADII
jgi:hypothetical protein